MGEFAFKFGDDGPVFTLPNMLHDEGVAEVLRYLFPPYGESGVTYRIGLSGMRITSPPDRPNPGYDSRDKTTTYAQIRAIYNNPDGGYTDAHRAMLGLDEQGVTMSASKQSGHAIVETAWAEFQNELVWEPTPDSYYLGLDPPLAPPPKWRGAPWEPVHEYPYSVPAINRDAFRDDPEVAQQPNDGMAEDEWRMVALPIEFAYLVTSTDKLLASVSLTAPILLPPQTAGGDGGKLYVAYRAEMQTLVAALAGGVG